MNRYCFAGAMAAVLGASLIFSGSVAPASRPGGTGSGAAPKGRSSEIHRRRLFRSSLAIPFWTVESDQSGALFGCSVACAGDVNDDGYDDVIIGAYMYDYSEENEGAAFLYLGGPLGLADTAAWMATGNQRGACFGVSVASAGDVNNDGYDDVIVGAHAYDRSEAEDNTGRVYVYLGGEGGLAGTACWTADGDQIDCYFGYSVAGAGNVNNDLYDDIIIGAHGYDVSDGREGRAYVYHGGDDGPSLTPSWISQLNQPHAYFGRSVAGAGNVNGDPYDDIIVGGYMPDSIVDAGSAYVFLGSANGVVDSPCWTAADEQLFTGFGTSVARVGDMNGDGCDEVIVGAYAYDNPESDEGAAYVYYGSENGTVDTPSWTAEGGQGGAWFGYSVAGGRDLKNGGHAYILIGAYGYDSPQSNEGKVFAYCGDSSGIRIAPFWTAESDKSSACFGVSVASAGDVNGDGFNEVIVGALKYSNPEEEEGKVFVYTDCRTAVMDFARPMSPLALHQNHPNPFNPATMIGYYLSSNSHVTLTIYDVSGRRIARLVDEAQEAGPYAIEWHGLDEKGKPASSGVYIYRLSAGEETISRKMILLR